MLVEVATSGLEPTHITAPLRTSLKRTRVLRSRVTGIDLEHRRALLTFVVAGGGFSGAELAGGLNDFARGIIADYANLSAEDLRIILVHSRERILPELSESLAHYARQRMQERGVTFKFNTQVTDARPGSITLSSAEEIATELLVWTAGAAPSPIVEALPVGHDHRGAVLVERTLALPSYDATSAATARR